MIELMSNGFDGHTDPTFEGICQPYANFLPGRQIKDNSDGSPSTCTEMDEIFQELIGIECLAGKFFSSSPACSMSRHTSRRNAAS